MNQSVNKEKEKAISTLSACLRSAKGGVKLADLNQDFKTLVGEPIPYKKFGHQTLEAFLRSIPTVKITNRCGTLYVEANATPNTAHLDRLISKQKPAKTSKKPRKKMVNYYRNSAPSRLPDHIKKGLRTSKNTIMENPVVTFRNISDNKDDARFKMERQNNIPPLMQLSIKNPMIPDFKRPRYVQPGITPSSPTKKLKEKRTPSCHSEYSVNQSASEFKEDIYVHTSNNAVENIMSQNLMANQKPKTVQNNAEAFRKQKSDISERLKLIRDPPFTETCGSPTNSPESEILSPLSPAQLISGYNNFQDSVASTYPPTSAIKRTLPKEDDSRAVLKFLTEIHNLSQPVYKITLRKPKNSKEAAIYAKVYVGKEGYLSYPAEAQSEEEAEKLAAQVAVKAIREKFKSMPEIPETTNVNLIKERVTTIVDNYASGVFMNQLPSLYIQQYKEKLPDNWMRFVEECPKITIEKGANNWAILHLHKKLPKEDIDRMVKQFESLTTDADKNKNVQDRIAAIVDSYPNGVAMHEIPTLYNERYKDTLPVNWMNIIQQSPQIVQRRLSDNSKLLYMAGNDEKASESEVHKMNRLNPSGTAALPPLQPPTEDLWMVFVTHVINTTEIWIRLIGDEYSEKFDVMVDEMREYYRRESYKPTTIEVGSYYVIYEDDYWHRVQCVQKDSTTNTVTVVFVDHGDEESYPIDRLYNLEKRFYSLPAQAMKISLDGLEDFNVCKSITNQIEDLLLNRSFYVEVTSREEDSNQPFPIIKAVFYDTEGPDDVNVNVVLSQLIIKILATPPKLEQVGQVYVSHVDQNGQLFVQIQSESMICLVNMLNRLKSNVISEDLRVTEIDKSTIYFVTFRDNYYRGKVTQICANNQIKVFCIDFGKTVTVDKANVFALDKISKILSKYPAQALKVHLDNIDKSMFDDKMFAKLINLAPPGEPILLKVISYQEDFTPTVELFKRIQPNNMLVSINTTLLFEQELIRPNGDGNNNVKPRKRVERVNSKTAVSEEQAKTVHALNRPKISEVGEYFDVHVTMAANPGNFTVQPFDDIKLLEEMMLRLQRVCCDYDGPPINPDSIKVGNLYAANHIDENWYRVYVVNIIDESMVTVYFCDFGDVAVLTLDKLQPLKSEFLTLPYQAIRATLVGIKPKNGDWAVEDCVRFQDLVVQRNFVSIVYETSADNLLPAEKVLGLRLIDVDTNDDIYIDKLLVDEGRAVFVNSD